MKSWALLISGIAAILIVCAFGWTSIDRFDCWRSWKDSNFDYKFSMISGCKIKTHDGWILSKHYRIVE